MRVFQHALVDATRDLVKRTPKDGRVWRVEIRTDLSESVDLVSRVKRFNVEQSVDDRDDCMFEMNSDGCSWTSNNKALASLAKLFFVDEEGFQAIELNTRWYRAIRRSRTSEPDAARKGWA